MNSKTDTGPSVVDTIKLIIAGAVLLAGITAYYYFDTESLLLRVVGVLAALAVAIVIAYQSTQGKDLWRFIQSSRGELRKVIWPNRQETMQTTLTVFVFVLIMGIFFFFLDKGLILLTGLLTGQG